MVDQSLDQIAEWSSDLQHSTLALSRLDGCLDMADPINRLVASSPSTCMFSPDHILQSTSASISFLSYSHKRAVAEGQLR